MHVDDFTDLLDSNDIVTELESGEIINRDVANHASIHIDSSNREALRKMDRLDVNELAVVNSEGEFVGVIIQDELVRKILTKVIREI